MVSVGVSVLVELCSLAAQGANGHYIARYNAASRTAESRNLEDQASYTESFVNR